MRGRFCGNYVILSPQLKFFFSRNQVKTKKKEKVFDEYWSVFSRKSSEDRKKVFTAIWDYIRPEFVGFIGAGWLLIVS